ncbi:MAG: prolyl oligopeptidase family serine peptidase [Holophagaceae bacterium]|nr:prolyl oligopeptidase family serine peptidase [Holophagaceae bacterium]
MFPHQFITTARRFSILAMLLALPFQMSGQQSRQRVQTPTAKKIISHDVYNTWKSIQGTRISADGQWTAFALQPAEGDGVLIVRNLKTGNEYRHERGQSPQFSADSKHVAFSIAPPLAEVEQARKDKKKPEEMPKNAIGVMELANGRCEVINNVKSFRLADEGGRYLAYLMEKSEEKKDENTSSNTEEKDFDQRRPTPQRPGGATGGGNSRDTGTDLVIRELATGTTAIITEVSTYQWNKDGSCLLYTVNSKTSTNNGLFALRASEPSITSQDLAPYKTTLLMGTGKYQSIQFDYQGTQVAFLSDRDDATAKEKTKEATRESSRSETPSEARSENSTNENEDPNIYKLYLWRVGENTSRELVAPGTTGLPQGWNVSEHGNLSFSKDGKRLFLGTAPLTKATPKDAPEPLKVDIWHWQDPELQTVQKVRAEAERNRNYRAVLHLDNSKLVQLANPEMASISVNENSRIALGSDDRAYLLASTWDAAHRDYYAVDLATGARRPLFKAVRFNASLSPDGRYAIAFDAIEQKWVSMTTDTGITRDLTGSIKAVFYNELSDTPEPPRPYGLAGWSTRDSEVLVYDRFDVWAINPATGASRQVTQGHGRQQNIIFRYVSLDADQEAIPTDKPVLLSATNYGSKATGYFRTSYQGGEPQRLIYADKVISGLTKAKNADVVTFTQQTFTEFPDIWTSGLDFSRPQKISNANPQQTQYRWGTQEMIEYVNSDGKVLKALLAKPEDFDPSKKYPMMVYIYEGMTDGLNRYVTPAPGQNINVSRFVSNGYLVLRPDIVYDTGFPGMSAMKCVLPAIEQVASKGYVDRERIGIQGHSWGGYQITYLITQTNIFRAVEAGASVSNMISAYGGIRYGTGISRQFQYERTQSRIGGTPWTKPMQFIENSPIFFADRVQTPYLTIHNDQDDAVPYTQAIEFFTALRRLGKEAYFFNYNGQLHGLRDREAVKHFTVHMCEFFDHYLLDAPRPEWMEKPTPYLERGKRDVSGLFKNEAEQK